jgi:hypothetical protein
MFKYQSLSSALKIPRICHIGRQEYPYLLQEIGDEAHEKHTELRPERRLGSTPLANTSLRLI